jgi:uncharacterized damage-inducible protein DinB
MTYVETFLTELEREADTTRRVLERVPEGRNEWKPHPKSTELGYLASLVAEMPGWIAMMVNDPEIDYAPVGGPPVRAQIQDSRAALLQRLNDSVRAAREALKNTTDEHLQTDWRILVAGNVVDRKPRHQMIRDAVFQHLAHHRGQLTVYLRLNEALVPAIYGPSADERF